MAGILQEADARLHRLCAEGNVDNVREYVDSFTDQDLLKARLNQSHKGVFGYTPLHEAVANGHSGVLMFLMGKGGAQAGANSNIDRVGCYGWTNYTVAVLSREDRIRL